MTGWPVPSISNRPAWTISRAPIRSSSDTVTRGMVRPPPGTASGISSMVRLRPRRSLSRIAGKSLAETSWAPTYRPGVTSTASSTSSMTGTVRHRPGRSISRSRSAWNSRQTSMTSSKVPGSASAMSTRDGGGPSSAGLRRIQMCTGRPVPPTVFADSPITACRAPRRSRLLRIRRPDRRAATTAGSRSSARPPGTRWESACCTHASSDSVFGGRPYSHRGLCTSSS